MANGMINNVAETIIIFNPQNEVNLNTNNLTDINNTYSAEQIREFDYQQWA
jgi:hypothetical protein